MSATLGVDDPNELSFSDEPVELPRRTLPDTPVHDVLAILSELPKAVEQSLEGHLQRHRTLLIDDAEFAAVAASVSSVTGGLLTRTIRRRNARAMLAAAGIGLVTLLAGFGGGYWAGRQTLGEWGRLAEFNNITATVRSCESHLAITQYGRRACALPIWLDPPQAVPEVGR